MPVGCWCFWCDFEINCVFSGHASDLHARSRTTKTNIAYIVQDDICLYFWRI